LLPVFLWLIIMGNGVVTLIVAVIIIVPVPVAQRSKARVYGRSLAGIAGSNPAGGMDGCPLGVLSVLSGRGICERPITRPEKSYRLWCVLVCDLGTSRVRRLKLVRVVNAGYKKKL
jgi:hypothetical protein